MKRNIKYIINGKDSKDGAGVKLRRIFAHNEVEDLDPFLLLDFFDTENSDDYIKGFPWHPHRGIETITYFIKGKIEHKDSLGNSGFIEDGDCQWMTAGSGIIHEEMPKEKPYTLGFQLWLNLSKEDKMSEPHYKDIREDEIPTIKSDNETVKVIAGKYMDKEGPGLVRKQTDVTILDVELEESKNFIYELDKNKKVFILVVEGKGEFNGETISKGNGILYEEGDYLEFKGLDQVRVVILSAKALKETIAWGGPIVMNTESELREAFRELRDGVFIKDQSTFI